MYILIIKTFLLARLYILKATIINKNKKSIFIIIMPITLKDVLFSKIDKEKLAI